MFQTNYLQNRASAGYWNQIGKLLYLEIRLKLITVYIRDNLRFWDGRLVRNNSAKALNNFTITIVVNIITTWFNIKKVWILRAERIQLFRTVGMKKTIMIKVTLEQATKALGGVEV